jgi:hypothetical protein
LYECEWSDRLYELQDEDLIGGDLAFGYLLLNRRKDIIRRFHMKHTLTAVLVLVIALCSTAVFAAQPLGGPSIAEPGKWAVSAGYFYSKDKWDSNTFNGDFKVETNTYYAQFSYGLAPGWDMYLRAGAADVKGTGELDLKDSAKFFGGLGLHGRFYENKKWNLSLGPVGNFAYYSEWKDSDRGVVFLPGGPVAASGELKMKDHYSFDVGFGFRWAPAAWVSFYGGPFYHYETAKMDLTLVTSNFAFSDDANVHPKKSFGTRLGVSLPFSPNVGLQLEGQYRDYFSGGGQIYLMF